MCLDGQTGALAVLKSVLLSRKQYGIFAVFLTGTEPLMTGKVHFRGFRDCLSDVLSASANVAGLSRRVKKAEPTNERKKTNLAASSAVPLIRKSSSKSFFYHFHISEEGFNCKSGGLNFMRDRKRNTAHRQLLQGT